MPPIVNGKPTLKDILIDDAVSAKTPENGSELLTPGDYVGKIISFVEEETYSGIKMEVNKKPYLFFYNWTIRDTNDLNAEVIAWMTALATIPTPTGTSMLAITNSAIGNSYRFRVYNYKAKTGKNVGKDQHAISFRDLPVIETQNIIEEEVVLPF